MTCTLYVAWDERLTGYDFGPSHPMAPIRLKLTMELARAFGLGHLDQVTIEVPAAATPAELELYHDRAYVDLVRLAGSGRLVAPGKQDLTERVLLMHGLGTEDDPVFPGMHEAAAMVTGATLAAARAVWTSAARHGASIAGGLHHAMARNASGFCVYNDPAIAIAWLLGHGAERIAYVDVDAHHGDGVERAFWDDPRVLTIGLHEHPDTLFPGTGRPGDVGGPHAEGSAVNVALPAFTRDAGWLRAFHAVVPPLLREFRPQILVSQHGCDSHRDDPLTNLQLTIDAQRAAHAAIHALAHEVAGGRWLLTGGGGYEHVHVVPRSWTHLLFEAAGRPLDPAAATPGLWREYVSEVTSQAPPQTMTEGAAGTFSDFEAGHDPADPVDRAILATRRAVFPLHGLLP
jgi:acetoin utilization protein AcuC